MSQRFKVNLLVFLCHALFLGYLIFTETAPLKKPKKQKVVVRTVTLTESIPSQALASAAAFLDETVPLPPPKPEVVEEPLVTDIPKKEELIPEPTAKPKPLPKSEVVKKPPSKKPAVKKETAPKPKPVAEKKIETPVIKEKAPEVKTPKKAEPKPVAVKNPPAKTAAPASKNHDKVLALMQESLAKLENTKKGGASAGSSKGSSSNAKKIDALGSETLAVGAAAIATYQEELAAYLKHLLQLPEMGEVKIRLTLSRDGHVAKLAIVSASSENNRRYVEKTVPTLSFPAFGERIKAEKEHTFPVTLKSSI